jgi:Tfp pilus assembly protein PilF
VARLAYSPPITVDVEIDTGGVGVSMKPHRVGTKLVAFGALVLGLLPSVVIAGGPVTVSGSVTDIDGKPILGVEVSALAQGREDTLTTLSEKKGQFSIRLPDFDLVYEFTFAKEGFEVVSTELRPVPEKLSPLVVTLGRVGQTPPGESTQETSEARDLAIPVFNEGVAALETGDKAAALEFFRESSEIDPDFPEAAGATAAIAMDLDDFATAADAAENLVRLQPDDVDAIGTAYFAELMLGDMERLIPSARRLAVANPEVVSSEMVQHARVLFDNNELAGSRSLLELIIEKEPDVAAAHLQLGLTCNMLGDSACAQDALEHYLELAPDGPDAATARSLLDYIQ